MAERITATLHHLVSTLDGFAEGFLQSRYGVSFSTFLFVAVVVDMKTADITTLARPLGVTKAAVSKRVPGLAAEGWVTTAADPHHGRRVLVSPTARAVELAQDAGGALEAEFTTLFSDPRLGAEGVDVGVLNSQLALLITLVEEKGPLA